MNSKKAKRLRRAMLEKKEGNVDYRFYTTPSHIRINGRVIGIQWNFTYVNDENRRVYKAGKKIYIKTRILPIGA